MKNLYQSLLLALGALTLAGTAYGQVPSVNDTSDKNENTGMGAGALGGPANTNGGSSNTASGFQALLSNTTGDDNAAFGYEALYFNSTGNYNTASGAKALFNNTGVQNTASGVQALYSNTSGDYNTAYGTNALYHNTTGSSNIAEGFEAGFDLTTGSNNIDIGNKGAAAESGIIRIGAVPINTAAYIAGIENTKLTGSAVYVTSTGQLGVLASSERYKTAIAPMGSDTAKLGQLRPVSFRLKSDETGTRQFGLIAEEVAKVYPELAIRDQKGRIDGVRYDELAPMLLNVVQRQQQKVLAQGAEIRDLKQQMAEMKVFDRTTRDLLRKLQAQEEPVARR